MKNKKFKKYYLISGIMVLIILTVFLFKNGKVEPSFLIVERGNLIQELFETGSTEKGGDIRLSFKEGGKIESVSVKEGEKISQGTIIAMLDKRDLELSLREARAVLISSEATLGKFLRGTTREELNVAEATLKSAETSFFSAESNFKEQEKLNDEALRSVYQNVGTLLGNVFLTVKGVEIGIQRMAEDYFIGFFVSETYSGRRSRDAIKRSVEKIEDYKDLAIKTETGHADKEKTLKNSESELKIIILEIDNIINVADSDFYRNRFSDTDKEILREYGRVVNGVLAEVISLYGNISSVNAEMEAKLTSARGTFDSVKRLLEQAEKEFSRITASPDSDDILVKQAVIDQAKVRVKQLENRIKDAILRSPVIGTVSSVSIKEGEIVPPGSPVIILVPEEDIQIAVNIYEGDISKVNIGNRVKASFVAFPGEEFKGEVIFVNPTGKIIDGVIYYTIKIILDEYPKNILPQMTVDVTVKTAEKENVLLLPERAIQRKEGKQFVTVLKNGDKIEQEISTGLRGEGRMVEITSGITEKERIIIN